MQVTDLWTDFTLQQIMGSPAYPRDRLKILKIYAGKSAGNISIRSKTMRMNTLP